jgi:hypothetical protein
MQLLSNSMTGTYRYIVPGEAVVYQDLRELESAKSGYGFQMLLRMVNMFRGRTDL